MPHDLHAPYRSALAGSVSDGAHRANVYNDLGAALSEHRGREREAAAAYLEAINLVPVHGVAYNNLAALLSRARGRTRHCDRCCPSGCWVRSLILGVGNTGTGYPYTVLALESSLCDSLVPGFKTKCGVCDGHRTDALLCRTSHWPLLKT